MNSIVIETVVVSRCNPPNSSVSQAVVDLSKLDSEDKTRAIHNAEKNIKLKDSIPGYDIYRTVTVI